MHEVSAFPVPMPLDQTNGTLQYFESRREVYKSLAVEIGRSLEETDTPDAIPLAGPSIHSFECPDLGTTYILSTLLLDIDLARPSSFGDKSHRTPSGRSTLCRYQTGPRIQSVLCSLPR